MNFAEKSVKEALSFLKEAIFSEEAARKKGFFQSIDPRLKLGLLILFIVTISFSKSILFIAALYCLSVFFAAASGISVGFFLRRVWFFIPLFTLVIALPAVIMGNVFSAVLFVARVASCVSFAVLVTVTTKHSMLLSSLRSVRVPDIFIQVLDMTYRYIFFFVKVLEETHMGLKARLVKRMGSARARQWVASRAGALFKRTMKMSEDVYAAMVARGYTGEFKKYGR